MLDQELAFTGVAGQVELVRRGDVSARELIELAFRRIEHLDRELNAFSALYPERALREAAEADARVAAQEWAPLLGIPVAVKDEIDIGGEITSQGTGAMVEPAAGDAEVVRRVRAAGAIVVGKTKMPELGLWPFTESVTWGVTRNPWDPERTPGLFGLKPQRDRVSRAPHDLDGSRWIVFGALTRSVLDGGVMLDVLVGGEPGFAAAAQARPRPLRIAVARAFPKGVRGRLSDDVLAALESTADLLRKLGHTVLDREIELRVRDAPVILGRMFRLIHDIVEEVPRPQRLERRTRAFARPGALVSDRMAGRLLAAEGAIVERIGAMFEDLDVLLTPVIAEPAMPAGLMEGRGALATYLWESAWAPFNILWNVTGQPAASVPVGYSREGLPLAVQLVGRPHEERTLLSLAAQLEAERPWGERRPAVS